MDVKLTQWGLNSYLELRHSNTLTKAEYKTIIRPDVRLLANFPNDPKFGNSKFWNPLSLPNGVRVSEGYKMKWDQIGPGKVEIRGMVAIVNGTAYMCEAYVKNAPTLEKRMIFRFQSHIDLIRKGHATILGDLK